MSPTQTATANNAAMPKDRAMHEYPIGAFFLGLLFLFPALCGITVQLTTSEAWFSGLSVAVSVAPHFGILVQPRDFF